MPTAQGDLLQGTLDVLILKALALEQRTNGNAAQNSFGKDALVLTVARGYLERLLSNPQILRYLERKHNDSLSAVRVWMENKQLSG